METKEKKKRMDLMFDIETLGTGNDAVVLSVAVKSFRIDENLDYADDGYADTMNLNVFEQLMMGRKVDEGTVKWWMKQSLEAKMSIINAPITCGSTYIKHYCEKLSELCEKYDVYVWSRGIDFDFGILDSLLRDYTEKENGEGGKKEVYRTPWKYWVKMDVRTWVRMAKIYGLEPEERETKHDAFWDCVKQIDEVKEAYDYMSAYNIGTAE